MSFYILLTLVSRLSETRNRKEYITNDYVKTYVLSYSVMKTVGLIFYLHYKKTVIQQYNFK